VEDADPARDPRRSAAGDPEQVALAELADEQLA